MSPARVEGDRPSLGDAPGPIQPTDSFRQAARVAMWPQVARLLELEAALRDADARDELKRYRVATRRLRAALRVFAEALPPKDVRGIQPELADLARAVGRTRDLDVRMAGLASWAAEQGTAGGGDVEPLRVAWAAERADAAAEVGRRLGTKRHARLVDDLVALVTDAPRTGSAPAKAGRAVRDHAASAVWASFERLRATATGMDGADLEQLHDLRIRAKRLRYTLEFLAPVLGAEREWLVARLVELQDHLGALNDAHLAEGAARAFLEGDAADTGGSASAPQRAAIESYRATQAATVERLRAQAPRAIDPILAALFAKRLSQAVIGPAEPKASRT